MKSNVFYSDAIKEISEEINAMVRKGRDCDDTLSEIGDVIWISVRQELQGIRSKEHHVHMADDVLSSVKKDARGNKYVSVRGGKDTGYKWHIVNDGHLFNQFSKDAHAKLKKKNPGFVPGKKFIEKSMASCQPKINTIVNEYVKGIAEDE